MTKSNLRLGGETENMKTGKFIFDNSVRVLLLAAFFVLGVSGGSAEAKSTGWRGKADFYAAAMPLIQEGMIPSRIAVRIKNGKPQFSSVFVKSNSYSYSLTVHSSRESVLQKIEDHRDPGPGLYEKLCLVKFARAKEGKSEHWIILMLDPENPNYRCLKMPSS